MRYECEVVINISLLDHVEAKDPVEAVRKAVLSAKELVNEEGWGLIDNVVVKCRETEQGDQA